MLGNELQAEKIGRIKSKSVCLLLLLSLMTGLLAFFSHCEHSANPLRQPPADCGQFLLADSVYAGRTKVVCRDSVLRGTVFNCPFGSIPFSSYWSPTWHPGGRFILFNHRPLERIVFPDGEECPGLQRWNIDAAGYWLSNINGSDMRRVSAIHFGNPAWSPDGEWLAFDNDAQIWKIRFNGACFDEPSLTLLTTEGRNFFPDWSPDGQWIAYDRSLADESGPGGIWIMQADGSNKRSIGGGVPELAS